MSQVCIGSLKSLRNWTIGEQKHKWQAKEKIAAADQQNLKAMSVKQKIIQHRF